MSSLYLPAIEVTRGKFVESIHMAAIAVVDSSSRVVSRLGSADHEVFLRSAAKPFQAMAVIESGAVERFGLSAAEIAVMSGSHSSEPGQVEVVASILRKAGLDPSALRCGTHTPFNREVAEEYRRRGVPIAPIHHNCSGKHAGMLASAAAGGHDIESYLAPDHPVQQRILDIFADMTGRRRNQVPVAVDGCGAPTLGATLSEAARAFSRLAASPRESARAVVGAMRGHPGMVAGQGMMDTELLSHPRHDLISKRGAEGVWCGAHTKGGSPWGIAFKIADGNSARARTALIVELLRRHGLMTEAELERLTEASSLSVLNDGGRVVGAVRAAFEMQG